MKTPNSIYDDTAIRGGIPVSSGDIIRIFCDVVRTIKVKRSTIHMEINGCKHSYVLHDPHMIFKVNGTAVLVRATTLDLSRIYVFDPKSDAFLGIVQKNIAVYGDKKSMSKADEYAIQRHGKKIKRIALESDYRLNEAMAIQDPEETFEIEVLEVN